MHIQFLIEDHSGEVLICKVMEKLACDSVTCDYKSFKGIGGFKEKGKATDIKTNKLLTDLEGYLKGFDKYFRDYDACIFIILDNDTRKTTEFRNELEEKAQSWGISTECVFCIAVEEMEAWLLGDEQALITAYPNAKMAKYREYVQDSICGTWEYLADIIFDGGLKNFKKQCPTYRERGKYKAEWAEKIGAVMDLNNNKSPSFRYMITNLRRVMKL